MSNNESPRLLVTERRQSQFATLDELLKRHAHEEDENSKLSLALEIERIKFIISVQGGDVGEFEY